MKVDFQWALLYNEVRYYYNKLEFVGKMQNAEFRMQNFGTALRFIPPSVTRVARATFPSRGKANIGSPLDGELSNEVRLRGSINYNLKANLVLTLGLNQYKIYVIL